MNTMRLNDKTFDDIVHNTQEPILVVFTAPKRCEHCRLEKPALEQLASAGVPVFFVDVEQDDSKEIERVLGGRGVPHHKLLDRGIVVREFRGGPMSYEHLLAFWQGRLPEQEMLAEHRTPVSDP